MTFPWSGGRPTFLPNALPRLLSLFLFPYPLVTVGVDPNTSGAGRLAVKMPLKRGVREEKRD